MLCGTEEGQANLASAEILYFETTAADVLAHTNVLFYDLPQHELNC